MSLDDASEMLWGNLGSRSNRGYPLVARRSVRLQFQGPDQSAAAQEAAVFGSRLLWELPCIRTVIPGDKRYRRSSPYTSPPSYAHPTIIYRNYGPHLRRRATDAYRPSAQQTTETFEITSGSAQGLLDNPRAPESAASTVVSRTASGLGL